MGVASGTALVDVRIARISSPRTVSRSRAVIARLAQRRRELLWAWLSFGVLILCWDASLRLDQRVSTPRPRVEHIGEVSHADCPAPTDVQSYRIQ